MPLVKYFQAGLFLCLLHGSIYLFVFSHNGWLMRSNLDKKYHKLKKLNTELLAEQSRLKAQHDLFQDENTALELGSKKYLMLDQNAQILRFGKSNNLPADAKMEESQTGWSVTDSMEDSTMEDIRAVFWVIAIVTSIAALLYQRMKYRKSQLAASDKKKAAYNPNLHPA